MVEEGAVLNGLLSWALNSSACFISLMYKKAETQILAHWEWSGPCANRLAVSRACGSRFLKLPLENGRVQILGSWSCFSVCIMIIWSLVSGTHTDVSTAVTLASWGEWAVARPFWGNEQRAQDWLWLGSGVAMTGAGLGVVLFGCLGGLLNLSLQALTLCAHQNMQKVLVSYFGYGCQRTTSGYAIHCPREIWQVFFSPSLLARISHRLKVY